MGKRIFKASLIVLVCALVITGISTALKPVAPELTYLASHSTQDDLTNMSTQNKLIIPNIGVRADISTKRSILDKGAWVQKQGKNGNPEVIAIHRYGLPNLSTKEQLEQTLYHAGKLKEGDEIIISFNDEVMRYRITEISESYRKPGLDEGEILIYTCLFFNNPKRLFITAGQI